MARIRLARRVPVDPQKDGRVTDLEAAAAVYARTRDPNLRDRIVLGYQPLARRCALNMRRHHEPVADLIQVANVALLEALDRYQPTSGTFETYARATIRGALRKHYRTVWRIHTPRSMQDNYVRYRRTVSTLTGRLGRTPTPAELAADAQLTATEAREAANAHNVMMPGTISWIDEDDDKTTTAHALARDDNEPDVDLHLMLAQLPSVQRRCLYLYFYEGRTQKGIGAEIGMSQAMAYKTIRAGLDRLRAIAQAQDAA